MRRLPLSRLLTLGAAVAFLAALLFRTYPPRPVSAQEAAPTPNPLAAIEAPQAGQTVFGMVNITGAAAVTGLSAYEVAFAYAGDLTATWFLIQRGETPVAQGVLAVWDTSTITDGLYDVRLRVFLTSGEVLETIIRNIDVRNYTPTQPPTETPAPPPTATAVPVIPTATPTPTRTPPPTPTPLPPNPAAVQPPDLTRMLGYGALIAAGGFVLLGALLSLHRIR